jgi:putative tryptophan/tyrosine transport system substrate-binding protein
LTFNERARIGAFALAKKLPTEVGVAEMVPFGALLSYGPDFPDYFRRAVGYVDKILKAQSRPTFRSNSPPASSSRSI